LTAKDKLLEEDIAEIFLAATQSFHRREMAFLYD